MRVWGVLLVLMWVSGCAMPCGVHVPLGCRYARTQYLADERDAILAARAHWHCIRPCLPLEDEAHWLKAFVADYRGGVWHVSSRRQTGTVDGGLEMDLSQSDGRIVEAYQTP